MRLLYLGSTDFPQPKARAIQIVNTCHALARAGVEVTLVVGRRGRERPEHGLSALGLSPHPRLRIIAVPVARIPPTAHPRVLRWFTRLWQWSYLAGLAAALPRELTVRRPDVVYARDLRTARLAARPARAVGARLGFEVHGLPSFEARLGAGRSRLPPAAATRLRRLEADVFARSDRIVTITECARRILVDEYRVPPERVRTIPDAAPACPRGGTSPTLSDGSHLARSPHPFPAQRTCSLPGGEGGSSLSPRERAGVKASPNQDAPLQRPNAAPPAVYYVGQLYPWKGADLLVDAATLVKEARFVIVGGLPSERNGSGNADVARLAARARQVGVIDRVDFRGYVPYAEVRHELEQAAVAVLPLPDEPVARYFTSPLKLFDYMAAGVPIVASDLPALREVLVDGENALLVRPDDPAALADGIERLLADPSLARRLADRARRDARAYTWEARAAQLIDFLLADGPAAPEEPDRG